MGGVCDQKGKQHHEAAHLLIIKLKLKKKDQWGTGLSNTLSWKIPVNVFPLVDLIWDLGTDANIIQHK